MVMSVTEMSARSGLRARGVPAFSHMNPAKTFGQDLAGVLTLGMWMPVDVRFRCKAPPTTGGVIPVPPSQ